MKTAAVKLLFKSRRYKDQFPFHSTMKIGLATAAHFEGPYTVESDQPIFGVDSIGEIEDPFLWRDDTGYHLIAKDQHGTISGHLHCGILAHSDDASHWVLDSEPLAYSRELTWADGKTIKMGAARTTVRLNSGRDADTPIFRNHGRPWWIPKFHQVLEHGCSLASQVRPDLGAPRGNNAADGRSPPRPAGLRPFCSVAALRRSGHTIGYARSLPPCHETKWPAAKCNVVSARALNSRRIRMM